MRNKEGRRKERRRASGGGGGEKREKQNLLTWRGAQVEHGAALIQNTELTVELDELEGRSGAVAVLMGGREGGEKDEFFRALVFSLAPLSASSRRRRP